MKRFADWGATCALALSVLLAAMASVVTILSWVDTGVIHSSTPLNAVVLALAFSTTGALVASRRPENTVGWLLCAIGLVTAVVGLSDAYASHATSGGSEPPPAAPFAAWLSTVTATIAVLSFPLVLLLFPDGRPPSRRWRPVAGLILFVIVAESVTTGVGSERFDGYQSMENPFHLAALDPLSDPYANYVELPLVMLCVVLPALSLVFRVRRSGAVVRQQLKWVVGSGLLAALAVLPLSTSSESSSFFWGIFIVALCSIPTAIGLAILRHRLYDIDVIINRTLVYGVLTATLGAVYLGGILTLPLLLRPLTEGSDVAVALSTLAVAVLFQPARRRIQDAVDRHFYRRKYDAVRALATFSTAVRDEVDLNRLTRTLTAVIVETVQPAHVAVWLRESQEGVVKP